MSGSIHFLTEQIAFNLPNPRKTKSWIIEAAAIERKTVSMLTFIFCSAEFIQTMNKKYLKHDYKTDVITFDYTEGNTIEGEIFISIPTVQENAAIYTTDFLVELRRVIIHGFLHLCGYNDKSQKQRKEMRERENFHLLFWS